VNKNNERNCGLNGRLSLKGKDATPNQEFSPKGQMKVLRMTLGGASCKRIGQRARAPITAEGKGGIQSQGKGRACSAEKINVERLSKGERRKVNGGALRKKNRDCTRVISGYLKHFGTRKGKGSDGFGRYFSTEKSAGRRQLLYNGGALWLYSTERLVHAGEFFRIRSEKVHCPENGNPAVECPPRNVHSHEAFMLSLLVLTGRMTEFEAE